MKKNSSNKNLVEILYQLFKNLTPKRKTQSILLIFLIIFSAIAETISLASAVPFLRIVTNSDQIWDIKLVRYFSNMFNITDPNQLLLPIFIAFALTAIIASTIKSLNLFFGTRLSASIGSDLSYKAFKNNLYQPYQFHISQNSSKLISINSAQINLASDVIDYTARFFSSTIIASFIVIYLFSFIPKETFFALIVFLISYLILGKSTKNKLDKNSYIFSSKSKSQIQIMQEAKGSIRDIILKNNYSKYFDIYKSIDIPMRRSIADNGFLSLYPKFILEGISLLTIALLAFKISFQNNLGYGDEIDIISKIGTLAIGAQKLLPNMQQSYGSWAYINGSKSSILNVLRMINKPINITLFKNKVKPILFNESIKINNLGFKYPNSNKYIFRNINLTIKKGEKIGIVGETGSGKSTLVDIIMGLLQPNEGTIEVDGLNIFDKNNPKILMSWRKIISHVPQQIYLSDSNFLENIAFSDKKVISKSRVEKAAKMAQIHSFIKNEPLKYQTNIGENGINLSGGQRQRIGIARALYDDSEVLVLDEATSALDNEIENKVMRSIYTNNDDKTLIIIAHRKNTINSCDTVIKLTKNKLFFINKESQKKT